MLYRATLRVFLILLHDFPDFLSSYHHSLVDKLPTSCIQLKNLILSAFPPDMRLPDPFTPNLKVNQLPEITQSPILLSDYTQILVDSNLKPDIDSFIKSGVPNSFYEVVNYSFLSKDSSVDGKYNNSIINSFVLYVGVLTISLQPQPQEGPPSFKNTVSIEIFQKILKEIDSEGISLVLITGRYLLLGGIANQLRYPNIQTHYFSSLILQLFLQAEEEVIKEQITRYSDNLYKGIDREINCISTSSIRALSHFYRAD